MNTGKALETKRLVLVPGNNARDDEPFINMLRNDGNFRDFCGIEFSEKYLAEFRNYFERTGHDECIYSIFLKGSDRFIGYVGFHRERNLDYEIEFYISKSERRKGYCEEGFVDEETDEFFGYCVAKYVLVREEGDSGDSTIS